jgi:hypothetical protein
MDVGGVGGSTSIDSAVLSIELRTDRVFACWRLFGIGGGDRLGDLEYSNFGRFSDG